MTALLEFKQKIKGIYAQYEMYLLPLLKFVLALVYFSWINTNMGYMTALDNIFIVLILSLICCILPSGMMIFAGFALMVGHCYALGIEVAAFLLVLILFMMILFLRFSSGKNIVLVFTPLAFAFDIPVLLPIGCGLLSSAVSALPAAGGVIIYYFVRTVRIQSQALLGMDSDIVGKLTLLSDSLMKNGEMWLTLIAFIAVVLAVNLIRTRMFDYAWRIAIVAGGVIYIVIMLAGSMSLGISISVFSLIIYTVVAVLVGIILEFFVFGGDYTRTERLEYEDDDYYYYVKAVPKALVATSERSIKKINGESAREERKSAERVVNYSTPLFQGEEPPKKKKRVQETEAASVVQKADIDDIDFENNTINVTKTLTYFRKSSKDDFLGYKISIPKTKSSIRTVPMNSICKKAIEDQVQQLNTLPPIDYDSDVLGKLLFVTRNNRPLMDEVLGSSIRTVRNNVNKIRASQNQPLMPKFSAHTFRHTFATRCFEAGIPPKTVQSYLGHTNIQMTMDIYTEVLSDKKMSDIKLLESTMNDINTCRAFQKIS